MYNLYIEQKKNFWMNQREREEQKKFQMSNKHQKEKKKMINNYSERVKNFILEMAKDSSKGKVKDFEGPIENCRIKYLEETNNKIKGKRGFLFGSFKSEKDRIKDTIEQNKYLFGNSNIADNDTSFNQQGQGLMTCEFKLPQSVSTNQPPVGGIGKSAYYKQPEMRFKPRTDLERIKESISQQKFLNENYDNIVSRQLKQLDLNIFHKIIIKKDDIKENEENKDELSNIIPSPEKNPDKNTHKSKVLFKKSINSEAKKFFPEFHYKTHFKAAEAVTISLAQERELKKSNSQFIRPSSLSANNIMNYDSINNHKTKGNAKMDYSIKNDCYTKNQNPYNSYKERSLNYENLQELKQIAFHPSKIVKAREKEMDPEENNNKYHDDEKIRIGNESFSINYQLDLIASRILNRCNVHHSKKSNSVKAREGKLMMTNGMTIKEFEEKFNLKL